MLDIIRKNASSWLVRFILGAIAIVFVFWGIGSFRSGRLSMAAKVNGETILAETYRRAYSNAIERYQEMFQGKIPEGFLDQIQLKQQVLDSLINEVLVQQEARRLGVIASDDEVRAEILRMPTFQENGRFNQGLYNRALRSARLTAPEFEEDVRKRIIFNKITTLAASGLDITEIEAQNHFDFENERIDIAFVRIDPSMCEKSVTFTPEDLSSWFDAHKEDYKTAPRLVISSLLIKRADLEKETTPTDEEISAFYADHTEDFKVAEQRKVRHILLRIPKDADDKKVEELRAQAEGLAERIRKGEDFAEVAKKYSQDPGSAGKGGELGPFSRGAMVKPFEDAVFAMQKGEISGPVRTPFGWHVIKLEEILPERTRELAEVRDEIARTISRERTERLLWEKARAAYDSIIASGGLEPYAEKEKVRLEKSGPFEEASPPAYLSHATEAVKALFALEAGELSSILTVPQGILIAEVLEKENARIPELSEVKDRVTRDFVRARSKDLCRDKARSLLASAREKGLCEAAAAQGDACEKSGFFSRSDQTGGGKLPPAVTTQALNLSATNPLPGDVLEANGSFYVIGFMGRQDGDPSRFESEKDTLKRRLLEEKRNMLLTEWLNLLRKRAEIRISPDMAS
ncbi:MAG: SurA N-terminal domain-containing protein [Deltaproteobacteria bacterium]